jgi:hypothetical protein
MRFLQRKIYLLATLLMAFQIGVAQAPQRLTDTNPGAGNSNPRLIATFENELLYAIRNEAQELKFITINLTDFSVDEVAYTGVALTNTSVSSTFATDSKCGFVVINSTQPAVRSMFVYDKQTRVITDVGDPCPSCPAQFLPGKNIVSSNKIYLVPAGTNNFDLIPDIISFDLETSTFSYPFEFGGNKRSFSVDFAKTEAFGDSLLVILQSDILLSGTLVLFNTKKNEFVETIDSWGQGQDAVNLVGLVKKKNIIFYYAAKDTIGRELHYYDTEKNESGLFLETKQGVTGSALFIQNFEIGSDSTYLFCLYQTNEEGWEPFIININDKSTVRLDINPGPDSSFQLSTGNGLFGTRQYQTKTLFLGYEPINGYEMRQYDPLTGTAKLFFDATPGPGSTSFQSFRPDQRNSTVYFATESTTQGRELYMYDEGQDTFGLVHDFYPGVTSGNAVTNYIGSSFIIVTATTPADGRELFLIDGIVTNSDPEIISLNEPFISVSPNPTTSNVYVELSLDKPSKFSIEILLESGIKISEPVENQFIPAGSHKFEIPLPETRGIILLLIHIDGMAPTVRRIVRY